MEANAIRLEANTIRSEAIASRLEAIRLRLEALRLDAIVKPYSHPGSVNRIVAKADFSMPNSVPLLSETLGMRCFRMQTALKSTKS